MDSAIRERLAAALVEFWSAYRQAKAADWRIERESADMDWQELHRFFDMLHDATRELELAPGSDDDGAGA